jgi:hypothetical protein
MKNVSFLLALLFLSCDSHRDKQVRSIVAPLPSGSSVCPCGALQEKSIPTPFPISFRSDSVSSDYSRIWNDFVSQIRNYHRPPPSILCLDLFLPHFSLPDQKPIFLLDKHPWADHLHMLLFIPNAETDSCLFFLDTTIYPYWNLTPSSVLTHPSCLKGRSLLLLLSSTPIYPVLQPPVFENALSYEGTSSIVGIAFQNGKTIPLKPMKWEDLSPSTRKKLYALVATYFHFLNKPVYGELKVNALLRLLEDLKQDSLVKLVQLSTLIPPY